MNNASLELGGTNWAEKDGNILGYSVGDTSGKYSPQEFTFARGSNLSATRIDRAGLIVKGRENVLLQSNQFDTTWLNQLSTGGTITGGQSGYDGTSDAWLINKGGGIYRGIRQIISFSGLITYSVYAKSGSLNKANLRFDTTAGAAQAVYDLTDGSSALTGGTAIEWGTENVGGGWYRLYLTSNATITNVHIYVDRDNPNTGNILIQDAQLELGLAASPYIETTTTTAQAGVLENTPRLNYTTGVANPYLLLEPSRTNLLVQSEYFGAWSNISQGTGSTPTLSIGGDFPLGIGKYYNLQCDLNGGTTTSDRSYILKGGLSATPFNAAKSIWIKNNSASEAVMFMGINFGVDKFTLAANADWQRITIDGGIINNEFRIGLGGGSSQSNTIDVSIFGAQCEAGTYTTSYIPTYSVSATRAQDVCNKTNASGEIGQTEGTMFLDISALSDDATNRRVTLSDGTATNRMYISYKNYTNQIRAEVISAGVSVFDSTYSSTDITQFSKIALAYKLNDFAFYVDGTQVSTDTSGAVPTSLTAFKFEDGSGGSSFFGNVNQAALYKERLTNAELATLTTI